MSKALFDIIRRLKGKALTQSEVDAINAAIGGQPLPDVPARDWEAIAVPLVQQFEGYHRDLGNGMVAAYPDPGTGGAPWTIGWGSTGANVKKDTVWTKAQAEAQFRAHLAQFSAGVEDALGNAPATAHQFAAMVSLAYNIGLGAFRGSTLLRLHKAGDYAGAAAQFLRWNRAGGRVMKGLVRRRKAESDIYRGVM